MSRKSNLIESFSESGSHRLKAAVSEVWVKFPCELRR